MEMSNLRVADLEDNRFRTPLGVAKSTLFRFLRILLIGQVLLAACPRHSSAADNLNIALKPAASKLIAHLTAKQQTSVSIGSFSGTTKLDAKFESGISKALIRLLNELQPGVVGKGDGYSIRGRFADLAEPKSQPIPSPEGSESIESRVQVRVTVELVDVNGNLIDSFRANVEIREVDAVKKPPDPPLPNRKTVPKFLTLPFSAEVARAAQKSISEQRKETRPFVNSTGMLMVWIPAGRYMPRAQNGDPSFDLGEDATEMLPKVSMFRIAATEVTQRQWAGLMTSEPWSKYSRIDAGPDMPAAGVAWNEALAFCRLLTDSEREKGLIDEGSEYRLPTELEWEWACLAGNLGPLNFEGDAVLLEQHARFGEQPQRVKALKPNAFGLYDTLGNVSEWCYRISKPSELQSDPDDLSAKFGVLRGGSFQRAPKHIRSHTRDDFNGNGNDETGFRVLLHN